jgi:Mrp family chromosome partitioning ATPase
VRKSATALDRGSLPDVLREPLRRLDTTLSLLDSSNGHGPSRKVILVTSAERGDGKSTLVRNLALVQRDAGKRVVILDSDLRAPVQERLLNVHRSPGLTEVLGSTTALQAALQQVPAAGQAGGVTTTATEAGGNGAGRGALAVLTAGAPAANPPALMTGPRLGAVLAEMRESFDTVLIDSPPPLAVSDVLPLLSKVDGIVLVSRIDHTHSRSIEKLLELLERLPNAPVIGVVANDVRADDLQDYGYGYPSH